jgi:hypothetical protein
MWPPQLPYPAVAAPWQGGILDLRDIIAQLLDNTLSIVLRDTPGPCHRSYRDRRPCAPRTTATP